MSASWSHPCHSPAPGFRGACSWRARGQLAACPGEHRGSSGQPTGCADGEASEEGAGDAQAATSSRTPNTKENGKTRCSGRGPAVRSLQQPQSAASKRRGRELTSIRKADGGRPLCLSLDVSAASSVRLGIMASVTRQTWRLDEVLWGPARPRVTLDLPELECGPLPHTCSRCHLSPARAGSVVLQLLALSC